MTTTTEIFEVLILRPQLVTRELRFFLLGYVFRKMNSFFVFILAHSPTPTFPGPNPCLPINPCGSGTCSRTTGLSSIKLKNTCTCPANFVPVNNIDKTQSCALGGFSCALGGFSCALRSLVLSWLQAL